jgi:DNA topoisomerase VI subunit A
MFYFLIARGTVKRIGKPNKERRIRDARFLGLRVDDWERIGFRRDDVGIRLSDVELGILNHLKSCPWLVSNHLWQREFDQMLQAGFKVEMEAMTTIGESYLADTYLPQRIKGGSHFQVFS